MTYEIWRVFAGIALFILGMKFLEDSLRLLTGRKAKLFLRSVTVHRPGAIAGGAIITGLVQSSSVVNLIVLGLVGAGTISMSNALAVILGTNVGTTLNTWIIATVGFKINIELLALPAISVAGILRAVLTQRNLLYNWLGCLLGLGFLFFGLDMMKKGMEYSIGALDLSAFVHYPSVIYLLIGLVLTSLTQSSAATVAIVLSALNAGAVEMLPATAMVLGSEVGTTLKLLVAALGKDASMKRVALGNLIFNTGTITLIFIFLKPLNYFITDVVSIGDPLMALAFFQTLINVVAVLIFTPGLNRLARFLESRYRNDKSQTLFIGGTPATDKGPAIDALERETVYFLKAVMSYCSGVFVTDDAPLFRKDIPAAFFEQGSAGQYIFIKKLHGDIYRYYVRLQNAVKTPEQTIMLERLIASVRNGMYAAKSIKDAEQDIAQLRNSGKDGKYGFYLQARKKAEALLAGLAHSFRPVPQKERLKMLADTFGSVRAGYSDTLNELYRNLPHDTLSELEISMIINFNREMYSAFKSLVMAIKDAVLTGEEAEYFDDLPGFIR